MSYLLFWFQRETSHLKLRFFLSAWIRPLQKTLKECSDMRKISFFIALLVFASFAQISEPVPVWFRDRPTPPRGANFFFVAESGTGRSVDEAKENAWQTALRTSTRGAGFMVYTDAGESVNMNIMRRSERCVVVLQSAENLYKVYVLFKIQRDAREKNDFDAPDGIICSNANFDREIEQYNERIGLANYYASKIEFNLNEAERNIQLSKQLLGLDRKREAREKLNESRKNIDFSDNYRRLLITADTQNGHSRSQNERMSELLKEISALQIEIERPTQVFIVTMENTSDIVISEIQTRLSENNVMVTKNREEADLILEINARICDSRSNGHFHFAYACVNIVLQNVKTGKNELTLNIEGQNGGGLNAEQAQERAFRSVVPDVWAKIKDKILENLQ